MTNPFREIDKQLRKNKAVNDQLQIQEFSKVVALTDRVRIVSDIAARAAPFGPNLVTVTGFGGLLPARITAVWWQAFVTGNGAANALTIVVKCPDSTAFNPVPIAAKLAAVGDNFTAAGFTKLGASAGANPGQFFYNLIGGNYNQLFIDVTGYLV